MTARKKPGKHKGYFIFMTVTCRRCSRVYEFTYDDRVPTQMEVDADRIGALVGCQCTTGSVPLGAPPATTRLYGHTHEFHEQT